MSEVVPNSLGRAQNLAFSVFSAILIVFVVAMTSLSENTSALARVNKEFADLNLVATHSDNVIREIRRYILAKQPSSVSEQQALLDIRHSFFQAHEQAELASTRLLSAFHSGVPLKLIRQANQELTPMRDIFGAIVSVNVDLSPQSVVLLDRLENLSFRDLSVMAHLVSVDPIGLNEVISTFNKNWEMAMPAVATQDLVEEMKMLSARRSAVFEQIGSYGMDLRQASERFGVTYTNLAAGGLQSSNTRALTTLIALQDKRAILRDQLSGSFTISVPMVDQTLPVQVVTLLLPLALAAGYGLIGTSLLFARRQLRAITDCEKQKVAADNGFMFDQLLLGGLLTRILNWSLLAAIIFAPLVASALLAYQVPAVLSCTFKILTVAFLLIAFGGVVLIFKTSYAISRMASPTNLARSTFCFLPPAP